MKRFTQPKVLLIFSFLFLNLFFPGGGLFAQTKIWTLKECVDTALKKNIQLNETKLTSKINGINYDQSKANLYPDFSVTDGQSFSFGYSTDPTTNQTSKQNIASNNLALNGSVTLYNGFQLKNAIRQSKYLYDAGNFDVEKMKNDIFLDVLADYLQVIYSYKALEIARTQVSNTQAQVEMTAKFVDAGKQAEGTLFQIQSQLATDKASVVSAENQLQISKVTLMQLMELPVSDNFEVDSAAIKEPSVESLISPSDIYSSAEKVMPEIKSAELKTRADVTGIDIAKALALPKLTLGGSIRTAYSSGRNQYSSTSIAEPIGYLQSDPTQQVLGLVPITTSKSYPFFRQFQDNFGQSLSLSLTIPIFNSFQAKYGVAKARIIMENSQLAELAVKDQLRKLIEQAYTDLTASVKNYAAAKEILKAEERSYTDMNKKFKEGLISATDYLIEEDKYDKAIQSLIQSKFNYIFKSKIVDFYLGKTLN